MSPITGIFVFSSSGNNSEFSVCHPAFIFGACDNSFFFFIFKIRIISILSSSMFFSSCLPMDSMIHFMFQYCGGGQCSFRCLETLFRIPKYCSLCSRPIKCNTKITIFICLLKINNIIFSRCGCFQVISSPIHYIITIGNQKISYKLIFRSQGVIKYPCSAFSSS